MEYQKSYKGLVVFFGCYFLAMSLAAYIVITTQNEENSMRFIMNTAVLGIAALMLVIYKTDRVYWINGISYEDARKASPEQRKAVAWAHLKRFGLFALAFLAFSCLSALLHWSQWVDFALCVAGIIGIAISTVNITL